MDAVVNDLLDKSKERSRKEAIDKEVATLHCKRSHARLRRMLRDLQTDGFAVLRRLADK